MPYHAVSRIAPLSLLLRRWTRPQYEPTTLFELSSCSNHTVLSLPVERVRCTEGLTRVRHDSTRVISDEGDGA